MHQDKRQPDDQARQFTGPFLFIRGSQRHKNENKRKDGLSDKGLQHFPLSKAVAPCHGRAGMWPRSYQYEKYG